MNNHLSCCKKRLSTHLTEYTDDGVHAWLSTHLSKNLVATIVFTAGVFAVVCMDQWRCYWIFLLNWFKYLKYVNLNKTNDWTLNYFRLVIKHSIPISLPMNQACLPMLLPLPMNQPCLYGFQLVWASWTSESGKRKGGGLVVFVNDWWCNSGYITIKEHSCMLQGHWTVSH